MPGDSNAINEKYVNMRKFCISFDFLNYIWDKELDLMSNDKVRRPYLLPGIFHQICNNCKDSLRAKVQVDRRLSSSYIQAFA
ncbi:MAG: hypothetical protein RBS85_02710 [Methanofastidiosum sp.]|nr:hypothetical protein [Methanofastidiosum sp.]